MSSTRDRGAYSRSKQCVYTSTYRLITAFAGDDDGRVLLPVLRGPGAGTAVPPGSGIGIGSGIFSGAL